MSVTVSTQAGGRKTGIRPGAHPSSAWEAGRQRQLTYTKFQAGLAPPQEIWLWGRISRVRACLLPVSLHSGKALSILRGKGGERVGWEWGVYIKEGVRKENKKIMRKETASPFSGKRFRLGCKSLEFSP
ncbi:unnamed protein product [Gulo gulo]|uniref:Uncharacterized protein n=1 Tax=Gulo gulo TaxID=48420 RepID=A0A9X9LEA9_GULGU|nr:unnamed protein product [Gulo gulo]